MEGEDELATYREWALPGRETHGLWEALMYDGTLKRRLLRYAASALHFADRQVDAQLVSWNRYVCVCVRDSLPHDVPLPLSLPLPPPTLARRTPTRAGRTPRPELRGCRLCERARHHEYILR